MNSNSAEQAIIEGADYPTDLQIVMMVAAAMAELRSQPAQFDSPTASNEITRRAAR